MTNELESENQKLKATLIDCRAEYLLFLDENPNAFAWDFDELSRETRDRYREDARKSLELEEPVIAIQLREAEAKIAELEKQLAEYRKPMKSMDTAQLSKWNQELIELLSTPDDERAYIHWQIAVGDHLEKFVRSWHSARITELEADLKQEEHNNKVLMNKIGEQTCYIVDLENENKTIKEIAVDERAYIYSLYVIESRDVDEQLRTEARQELAEEHPEIDWEK